eukprot:Colp12_sorted_trinity150504_noHs@12965
MITLTRLRAIGAQSTVCNCPMQIRSMAKAASTAAPKKKAKEVEETVKPVEDLSQVTPQSLSTNIMGYLNYIEKQRRLQQFQVPKFRAGDVLAVKYKDSMSVKRENRFVGICISISKKQNATNFTLRNVVSGLPVEKRFPMYSPLLTSIEVLERNKRVHTAKLYYLRKRRNKDSYFSTRLGASS